jgi:hypothetical protein
MLGIDERGLGKTNVAGCRLAGCKKKIESFQIKNLININLNHSILSLRIPMFFIGMKQSLN